MTHEEAIIILRDTPIDIRSSDDIYTLYATAQGMAIEALEKQVSKKPLHMHKNYYCPICKEDGWMLWDDAVPNDMDKYCGKCGQAIDWSDQND